MEKELTGSPQALARLFVPTGVPHGPVFRPTRELRKKMRQERLDNWTRALRRGMAAAVLERRAPATASTETAASAAKSDSPQQETQKGSAEKTSPARFTTRDAETLAAAGVASSSWQAGQLHFCREYRRKQTEGKRRVHARRCATCKEFLKEVIRQKLLASVAR